GATSSMPVPAYVHASDATVSKLFIDANGATHKVEDVTAYAAYVNPGTHSGLQRVVVSKLPDSRETLAQAFQNAWKTVFSKNYRSRVYFTGLSAGAMNSLTYGLNNITRIAGVAPHSAPFGPPALVDLSKKAKATGQYLPMYFVAGNKDMYKPLPVNDTPRSF